MRAEPSITVAANGSVYEAAVFRLFREYDRASTTTASTTSATPAPRDAELFLRLSAELVDEVATQLARSRASLAHPAETA